MTKPRTELQAPKEQYDPRVEMHYSTEISGNWIWQDDQTMDDGMRAVVEIHEGSPLFNSDGSWNYSKLTQLARFLLDKAANAEKAEFTRYAPRVEREKRVFYLPDAPLGEEYTKFPELGMWVRVDKSNNSRFTYAFCIPILANGDPALDSAGEIEVWENEHSATDMTRKKLVEDYFGVKL